MTLPKFKLKLNAITALNVVGGIVVLYLAVVLVQTVQRNYKLGRQIDELNAQIVLLQNQKDQIAYNTQYYKTDSFRDREARSKLGLQQPGENVVIIPRTSPTPTPAANPGAATTKTSNLQQWLNFLSGRS